MKLESPMEAYLQASPYINFHHADIQSLSLTLQEQRRTELDRIRAAFEYVRDEISHSYDIQSDEVTRTASDVLEKKHGICYAKSHLLAALLRSMGIPAGIAYQRLTLYDEPKDGHCIHALNTVYLRELDRWIRLDARGNKPGVDSQFSIEEEKLAFPIRETHGEKDYARNYAEPHPAIIQTLERYNNCIDMYRQGLPEELDA